MHTDRDTDQTASGLAAGWPEVMERARVSDAAFATAYARLPDHHRALIKTGIAAIYAACGGPLPPYRRETAGLGHDLSLTRQDVPLDFAVVLCGPAFASPARLAAAVIPALCARVPEVAAVTLGKRWPGALLTTLELCGVETACRLGPRSLAGLWEHLGRKGGGAVILLDGAAFPNEEPGGNIRLLTARTSGKAGLVTSPGAAFDRKALALAHPDLTFFVHGGDASCQEPFHPAPGGLAEAATCGYDALYVGEDRLERALGAARIVLGPGRETFWLWPQLSPDAFRRRAIVAAVDTRATAR